MSSPLNVAVVGGGIAGLVAALGFVQAQKQEGKNVTVSVYESAAKFGEIGAGPNAGRALKTLGLGSALQKSSGEDRDQPEKWFDFHVGESTHGKAGEYICTVGSHLVPGLNVGTNTNVHRADFLSNLVDLLPEGLAHFHHRCSSYTPHKDGITLHFATDPPTSAEADVVIASDGIKSNLRKHLFTRLGLDLELQTARYSEWIAWRGLIPRDAYEAAMGKGASAKQMLLGRGRHILTFPVRSGALINIVGFVRDPEHLKLGDKTGPWTEERPHSEMLEDYATFTPEILAMLKAIEKPSIWGIFALPPFDTITDERIVLIGDAAHGMTPHQGSGAGQAIEDALFVSKILSHDSVSSSDPTARAGAIKKALQVYADVRVKRGLEVARTSYEAGLLYEFQGANGEGSDVEKIKASLVTRLEWIWEYDEEKVLAEALARL
ncbi:salicylate hydroxylase, partial [Phenoliferia sp. Uapishka_3]